MPADFLATPEIWQKLIERVRPDPTGISGKYVEPAREALLRHFEIDSRVLSYDMFCEPPESVLRPGATVDWWGSLDRSTPNRMWRQRLPDGTTADIWGTERRTVEHGFGAYDELARTPLSDAESLEDLKRYPWPEPDWWNFDGLPELIGELDAHGEYHLRFRVGSVFEIGWQLRGMQEMLIDLVTAPEMSRYVMSRLTELHLERMRRVLDLAGDRIDMVYFYDDVATQNSLMMSPDTWRTEVRPYHQQLVEAAHARGVPVMYHCDGSIYRLIPELIELGVDLLNPIQPDAKDMDGRRLKEEFGDRLSFHGGIDIVGVLPNGTPEEVADAVRDCVDVLGRNGGYILCSSHHIQPDTPVENIEAMYNVELRRRSNRTGPHG